MALDLRLPIGLLFGLLGGLLFVYGLVTGSADIYQKSEGINVNLWWGLIMIAFATLMLTLARRAAGKA